MKYLVYSFILAVCCISCARVTPLLTEKRQIPERKEVTIVFTNSSMGAFEPQGCGCRRLGGFTRRARFLRETQQTYSPVLALDTGNVLFAGKNQSKTDEKIKAAYMLSALNEMGIDGLNIGAHDCRMGSDFLTEKEEKLSFPLLSANIRSSVTKDLVFKPYVIKTIGGTNTGIFGLTGGFGKSFSMKGKEIFIDDPLTSAQQAVKKLQKNGCSPIILLSQLDITENRRMAQQVAGIDFILGSSSDTLLKNPEVIENTTLLSPGRGGRYAAVLRIVIENDFVPFYNLKTRESVEKKIYELREKENNPETSTGIEEVLLKRVVLEEKLKSFKGKNTYRYDLVALDEKLAQDRNVKLILEKYKEQRTRSRLSSYKINVPTINLTELPEEKRLMALRLLNEISCTEDGSVAELAAAEPFCRRLARMIVESVGKGESEGKIRYGILYEKGKVKSYGETREKNSLDKHSLLQ